MIVICWLGLFAAAASAQNAITECAKKTNCCECAAYTAYACIWDTAVARKRSVDGVEQVSPCVPNAARKRNADETVVADDDAAAAHDHELAKRGFVQTPAMCPCGDGNKCAAANEQCDDGKLNGTPQSCCTTMCTPKADGSVCNPKAAPLSAALTANFLCDADDVCKAGVCQPTVVAASATLVCRATNGPCDVQEVCDGRSQHCPSDRKAGTATVCRPSTDDCDQPEVCDGANVACPADRAYSAGRVCRAALASELCDDSEKCDGTSFKCPADNLKPSGTICRTATGPCDLDEMCDGTSKVCPVNAFRSAGFVCRAANGVCDVDDQCTGSSAACSNVYKNGDVCRPAAGPCDAAETCNGALPDCPADRKFGATTVCRVAAGTCDKAEVCDGTRNECPADNYQLVGFVCRSAAGKCDVEEKCNGVDAQCPIDAYRNAGYVCDATSGCYDNSVCSGDSAICGARARIAAGLACRHPNMCYVDTVCDASGVCGGGRSTCQCVSTAECVPPSKCAVPKCNTALGVCEYTPAAKNTVCRAAATVCDVEEVCDGVSTECPGDAYRPKDYECRKADGVCDIPEKCSGFSIVCPPNEFFGEDKICREAPTPCMLAGRCSGTKDCPLSAMRQADEICDDGDRCTIKDKCTADGKCVGKFSCECKIESDCWPVAFRKRGADAVEDVDEIEQATTNATMAPVRVEDLCQEYKCLNNTCSVKPRASCEIVGQCALGTGGCGCKADKSCDTSYFPFACNATSGKCETTSSKCIVGSPGCPCAAGGVCMSVARKRGYYLRCSDGMCRIDQGTEKPTVACKAGEEGCTCPLDGSKCGDGLVCNAGFCTANCVAGAAGCTCRRSGGKLCLDDKATCKGNRCVFFTEDCGTKCVRGDPGCCCKSDDTCTAVQRKRADAATEFVYVNTCNKDKICTVDSLAAAPQKMCGTHLVGDMWMSGAQTCRCTAGGEVCDAKDCFGLLTPKECNSNADSCVWGTLATIGVGCFNRADNKALGKGVGQDGDACTLGGKLCDAPSTCDLDTLTCKAGAAPQGTTIVGDSAAAGVAASLAALALGVVVASLL